MVLVFIALVIAGLAALSLGLMGLATVEYKVVIKNGHTAQLAQVVQSGIDAAAKAIDNPEHPDLFDNPEHFCGIEVVPAWLTHVDFGAGRFTVFSPRCEHDQVRGARYGLTRESAKLSLETVFAWETESAGQGIRALQKLPGITPAIVDSILDWLDADDDPRPQGAEKDYYKEQEKTYRPRNGVPIALEELLWIRDVERKMLFGEDHQLSFGATQSFLRRKIASRNEFDAFSTIDSPSSLASDGFDDIFSPLSSSEIVSGDATTWQFLLTPYSAEKIVNAEGIVRIFLNESNLEFLESQLRLHQLDDESIQFILAWRNSRGNIDDPIDLLDADIEATPTRDELRSPFSCANPLAYERFLRLLDETTSNAAIIIRGRINVNEAPQQVLEAVPELTPDLVATILGRRKFGETNQRHAVWLLAENIVDRDTMKTLSRRLTTGGDVYRVQVAGFFDGKPTILRAEAVLDATVKPPRTVFYKDLTPLGFPE
jgi:hypothetical protein